MKVVITGGRGFIGTRLARALLDRGTLTSIAGEEKPIDELLLFDSIDTPELFKEKEGDTEIQQVVGDISDRDSTKHLIDRDDISVFHLASVVSREGETDFDLAMRVNLDGSRNLLETLRARGGLQRIVFASSIAVFGGAGMPNRVGDAVKQTPQTTYGTTKAMLELLINDYTRKGFVDGRSARLPTVIIRPGEPNLAASSFVSGVFREPLNGVDFELPVPLNMMIPVLGYRAIVANLIKLHEIDPDRLGDDRAVGLPSHTATVQQMIDSLQAVADNRVLGTISVKPDPFILRICQTWPQDCTSTRATELGLRKEKNIEEIVRYYIDDYL